MQIDTQLMEQFDTALSTQAAKVPLGDTGLSARVMPASMSQIGETAVMISELLDLQSLAQVVMSEDGGKTMDEALLAKLLDLLAALPELRVRWTQTIQPNTDVDLNKVLLFQFAHIAVTFLLESAKGSNGRGWLDLGKSVASAFGSAT